MRITVKNLLLLLFFLAAWYVVFLCSWLYGNWQRARRAVGNG